MKTYDRHGNNMYFCLVCIGIFLLTIMAPFSSGFAQNPQKQILSLEQAVVCENIKDFRPVNPGLTFSIENGSIICFTRFAVISEETFIWHRWYRKGELVTEKQLVLKPPQWSTYSLIQLREFDKGPWRVDIVDANDQVITILRFSVTE